MDTPKPPPGCRGAQSPKLSIFDDGNDVPESSSLTLPEITISDTVRNRKRWRLLSTALSKIVKWTRNNHRFTNPFAGYSSSLLVHILLLIVLALWTIPIVRGPIPHTVVVAQSDETRPDELMIIDEQTTLEELDARIQELEEYAHRINKEIIPTRQSVDPVPDVPLLPDYLDDSSEERNVALAPMPLPWESDLNRRVEGLTQQDVHDLEEALDVLTKELLSLLEKEGKLLVIWCFDQSESMKEERGPIYERIDRIYSQLHRSNKVNRRNLATGVTAFGGKWNVLTEAPTSDVAAIQRAISSIDTDPSGREMVCTAVIKSLEYFGRRRGTRRPVIILVTDESGDPKDNENLEIAVAEAKKLRSIVYVLGREAAFGSHEAHMAWRDPDTGKDSQLPIDRGPETAFVEQIQFDHVWGRYEIYPSGYGPYAQMRLAAETDGKFFLIPDEESDLIRTKREGFLSKRMFDYAPEYCSLKEYGERVENSPFRRAMLQVIKAFDLDVTGNRDKLQLRTSFSVKPDVRQREMLEESKKAERWKEQILKAIPILDAVKPLRNKEPAGRWRANFDLMYAQLHVYLIRTQEYVAFLDYWHGGNLNWAMNGPPTPGPNGRLEAWHIVPHKELIYLLRPNTAHVKDVDGRLQTAITLLQNVIKEHNDTPWAFRANRQLELGFSFKIKAYIAPPFQPDPGQKKPPLL
jgi:hypothetical protein